MKKILLVAAVALTLAGCGKTGNKDAEADKNVSMFRTEEVVAKKQLSLPDSLNFYGKDAKVFTETTVSVCWPETLGGKEPKELQDSILSIAFGTSKRATLKESLQNGGFFGSRARLQSLLPENYCIVHLLFDG